MVEFITEGMSDATTLTLTYIVRVSSFKMAFRKELFSHVNSVAHGKSTSHQQSKKIRCFLLTCLFFNIVSSFQPLSLSLSKFIEINVHGQHLSGSYLSVLLRFTSAVVLPGCISVVR